MSGYQEDSDASSPSPYPPPLPQKKELTRQKLRKISYINKSLECGSGFTTSNIFRQRGPIHALTFRQAKDANKQEMEICCLNSGN